VFLAFRRAAINQKNFLELQKFAKKARF